MVGEEEGKKSCFSFNDLKEEKNSEISIICMFFTTISDTCTIRGKLCLLYERG